MEEVTGEEFIFPFDLGTKLPLTATSHPPSAPIINVEIQQHAANLPKKQYRTTTAKRKNKKQNKLKQKNIDYSICN